MSRSYAVTGDHSCMIYSRHSTIALALAAARRLARRWGPSHPGSEPHVVDTKSGATLYRVTTGDTGSDEEGIEVRP